MVNFKVPELLGVLAYLFYSLDGKPIKICWSIQSTKSHISIRNVVRVTISTLEDCKASCIFYPEGCKLVFFDRLKKECYKSIGQIDPYQVQVMPGGRFGMYLQHKCSD